MKSFKRGFALFALFALAGAAGLMGMASAAIAAGPNEGGTNFHGVVLSYLATSRMSPGQMHKDFGATPKDVQATADLLCCL